MTSPYSRENRTQKFQLCSSSFFLLSFLSSVTQKLYSVCKRSTRQTNAVLSEIFLFLVRAACALRSTSYGQNTCCGFPVRHFVHNYTHNLKTKGATCITMFYLSNDYSTIGDIYSLDLELYTRYVRGVVSPNPECNSF